jgi:uncharacterized protein involved in type VI secretion and phage assembly
MSAHSVVHTIRRIARDEAARQVPPALGVVKSVFGRTNGESSYACTVELRETGLVLPRVPVATGAIGLATPPREGDLVLLVFVGGDMHAPVVVGRLYNETVNPPVHAAGDVIAWLPGGEEDTTKNLQVEVKTPGDGTRTVHITIDGPVKVEVQVDDGGVRFQAQDTSLTLSQSSASDGRAELKVGNSSVVIEQAGNVTVTAGQTLTLKGAEVEISADTTVKIAGQTIDLN